ncbi:predicted protein [Nematostella vectensis]|uniref:phospholipase D n=1 Tax=Nematostella vectensis TaxID=45351 RepID=A7RXZ6_NEMVE|nr:predicted protein [Nematostella vectensis]|eukprot:XP_001635813.1 predicted protein [Nematostella vectensis]
MSCGIWSKRWFIVKDSFVAYISQKKKRVRGVLLLDKDFTFCHGRDETNVRHGLIISNQSRKLLLTCWTDRKAGEFMRSLVHVMATTGAEWLQTNPHDSYAPVRPDTQAQWFVDGASYFDSVALALQEAREEIFITDWWLSPEIYLRRPVREGDYWRLDQILKRKAELGVKVYVLLYKEVELALTINSAYTKALLASLHPNIKVLRHPDHVPGSGVIYWAHHEKIVAIDQKVAFVGGLDLCFGRWDDHHHRLTDFGSAVPSFKPHIPLNKTSQRCSKDQTDGGIKTWFGKDYSNPIKRDFFDIHKPFDDSVDRGAIPRMPWHDVGVAVYGVAARDVARHFILRWNATKKVKEIDHVPLLLPKSNSSLRHSILWQFYLIAMCFFPQVLRSVGSWSAGIPTEASIHQAYLDAIHRAEHFIYIENQFFITNLPADGVRNEIGEALLMRIQRAHRERKEFRVIVVMPLLPAFEGELGTPTGTAIGVITHWNYRSICRGADSLLGRLSASIEDPSRYISFYALRTHSEIHGKPITELVYVHTKMMVVDDRVAIIGSANINDRSMLGKRDSEIAVRLEDRELVSSVMNGEEFQVGPFAHSLRTHLFMEHLGLESCSGEPTDVNVQDPVSDGFYKDVWMRTAENNTKIYSEVFHCLPTDEVRSFGELALFKMIEPLVDKDRAAARESVKSIRGNLVTLPLHFMEREDLRPPIGSSEYLVSSGVFT